MNYASGQQPQPGDTVRIIASGVVTTVVRLDEFCDPILDGDDDLELRSHCQRGHSGHRLWLVKRGDA